MITELLASSAFDLLALPNMTCQRFVEAIPQLASLHPRILERIDIEGECAAVSRPPSILIYHNPQGRYTHHVRRQANTVASFLRDESLKLDPDLDYWTIPALSHELKERLSKARPVTFGAAQRLEGATPGGLLALYSHIRSRERRRVTKEPLIPSTEAGLDDAALPQGV